MAYLNIIRDGLRFFLFFFFFLGAVSGVTQDSMPDGYDGSKLAKIKTQFDGYYLDGRIPNYAFGLYSKDALLYSAVNGRIKLDEGNAVDLDTMYWMASMTKPLVSAAVLKLVEEGKVSLDDKLSKYYPDFSDMLVAPSGSYDNTLEEANRQVTLRDLISHTAGMTYGTNVTGVGDVAKQYDEFGMMNCYGSGGKTLQEHLEVLAQLPLIAHPGDAWNYSVGIDVLGAVIEKVTGTKLDIYLKEEFFEPLKMDNSGFFVPVEKRPTTSRIYSSLDASKITDDKGSSGINWKLAESPFNRGMTDPDVKPSNCASGGGGLFASINDYAVFLQMIANDGALYGNRVLEKETVALLFEDQTSTLLPEAFTRAFGDDISSFMRFTAGFGMKMSAEEGTDYFFWGGAANTFFWLDKDNDSIGVFATQLIPSVYNVSDSIEEIVDQARF